ncbi:hypothetical protein COW81_00365 [Candidatus Campbellbacteria bacterium CG22_combo_CG10-13_8_21_14_all_36_13]|uniref:Type II toxin-antitoxin system antitoxin, RelB/DinJ family n=1 Tax=Candidatus Campbellbacteria bacterium CG22_combo_CG10-13_8_21_14_all_36_13 TaxID=1974529 RepID=A0A2H0DYY3_9BACT|nr:MAG: hypothetical protein COW81_00365 [Candidatus Campbellbacteria bacterium CG22_combo_CG10-13_8_21_14_all_36_13]
MSKITKTKNRTAIVNIKTDPVTKRQAQSVARALGVPLSLVLNESLKRFVREKRIVFEAEGELRPEVGKAILKASEDYKKGKDISPSFSNWEDAMTWLNS